MRRINKVQRVLLRLEFDGKAHCGWAAQDLEREKNESHKSSVQNEVEKAVQMALHLKDKSQVFVKGCGRTDAGVSAEEYYAHFDADLSSVDNLEKLRARLNGILPASVAVTHLSVVQNDFDSLENVKEKKYTYRILLRRAKATFESGEYLWLPHDPTVLNWAEFDKCVNKIQGTHDFNAFKAAHGSAQTSVRTVRLVEVNKIKCSQDMGLYVLISFWGAGFLKHMVRNLVGFLIEVLEGKKNEADLCYLLGQTPGQNSAPERLEAGLCAPAMGLRLEKVIYK